MVYKRYVIYVRKTFVDFPISIPIIFQYLNETSRFSHCVEWGCRVRVWCVIETY